MNVTLTELDIGDSFILTPVHLFVRSALFALHEMGWKSLGIDEEGNSNYNWVYKKIYGLY